MRKDTLHIILAAFALLCWTSSCVYPFEADIKDADSRLVVEGDIILGDLTEVSISYMASLSGEETRIAKGNAWVEDDKGNLYKNTSSVPSSGLSSFTLDTRSATADHNYRLHLKLYTEDGVREYASAWATPSPAPVIDGISFLRDADSTTVQIGLSLHSDEGCQYFRWSYRELWKYHADYIKEYDFDVRKKTEVQLSKKDYSLYWCWNSTYSKEIKLCATTDLTEDRITNHKFLKLSRSDKRFEERYRLTVTARSISADAYRFISNMNLVSSYTGSLFSSTPSDVVGNISCLDDPKEFVIGFIDVGNSVSTTVYVDRSDAKLYVTPRSTLLPFVPVLEADENYTIEDAKYDLWNQGYAPVYDGTDYLGNSGVLWDYKRCLDCRSYGGTLETPEGWEE